MNFYPFHIGDYISHTSHLSDEEDLAYRRMIDLYYQSELPFTDIYFVARRVKSTPEIVSNILSDFFVKSEDGWRNKRADEEIEKYHAKAESARNANKAKLAKKTELKPVLKSETKSEPNQDATKNQEPRTNNQIIKAPEGVAIEVWNDFKSLRTRLRAPITETVIKGLNREAETAKMSLQAVLEMCCERGWRGFKAEWVKEQQIQSKELPLGTDQQIAHAYKVECGGDPTQSRFNSYFDMRKYILDFRDKQKRATQT